MKYRTLHHLGITYRHTYHDVHTLPCVDNVINTCKFVYIEVKFGKRLKGGVIAL